MLKRNEPTEAGITGPVLLLQGTKDDFVLPAWTADVARRLQKPRTTVKYRTYDATHNGVLAAASRDVNAWIRARLPPR